MSNTGFERRCLEHGLAARVDAAQATSKAEGSPFTCPNAVALTHEEEVRWSMMRKEERRWPRWLTWGVVSGGVLGLIQFPDIIDGLERWPKMFEAIDTGTLLAIAFVVVLLALGALIAWPIHHFLVERPARKLDQFQALAEEMGEAEQGISEALERGDRMVSCGSSVHRLRAKLEKMDIPTPSLPPPQVPMPRHKAQEWYDVLVRLRPLAELRDIKGAKNARRDAEFEWHWFTQALAKEIANEEDTGKQADILESMAEELRKTGQDG